MLLAGWGEGGKIPVDNYRSAVLFECTDKILLAFSSKLASSRSGSLKTPPRETQLFRSKFCQD
ncbi:MAG: hypothetical protein A3D65_05500 [Candidatus Lloydbacteria bacterium RIFCSPHIGHO2_02_FULL_50_13]|uniref:Uncharacterized protein n=1 Tax=Candidatus Lloydbacteria bacterium RIFCSPHIGHO2_02_FULL_50_13 TaxID=1798661 RepID=A0A1G2D8E9_9BACT|nr:MAG: hypothetical protein A3D65_05500 [Candidatus Lloydbacteria bacterium RIFCSPHIGHO2_02_FULL_50_13]